MAFCVSFFPFAIHHYKSTHRILEMQVILSHLVGKYSFAEVEDETIRPTYLNNLLPIVKSGERAVPLYITRV
jgi:hypothetical protein